MHQSPRPMMRLGNAAGGRSVRVGEVAFGCGPRAGLMTSDDLDVQTTAVAAAIAQSVTHFDTAQLYGDGISESNVGRLLASAPSSARTTVSTKVRLERPGEGAVDVVQRVEASLRRLGRESVDLLVFHNRLISGFVGERPEHKPGPDLLAKEFVRPGGPWEGMRTLRDAGKVRLLGLTGLGSDLTALEEVLQPAPDVDVLSVEHHLLDPVSGPWSRRIEPAVPSHSHAVAMLARRYGVSLLALRALGGGALVDPRLATDGARASALAFRSLCQVHGTPPTRAAWWFATATSPGPVIGGFRSAADVDVAATGRDGVGVPPSLRAALFKLGQSRFD